MAFDFGNINFGNLSQSTGFGAGGQMTFGQTKVGGITNTVSGLLKSSNGGASGYDSGGFGAALSGLKMVPVYGQALALVEGIIGKDTINKTIGAFFANGFKIKCWGSSWSPSRADREMPPAATIITAKAKAALNVTPDVLEASINQFMRTIYTHKGNTSWAADRSWLKSTARDCTKEGLKKFVAGMDKVISESIKAFSKAIESVGGKLIENGTVTIDLEPHKNTTQTVKQYKVSWPRPKTQPTSTKATAGTSSRLQNAPVNVQKAGGGGMALLGLAALGFFMFKKK